MGNHRVSHVGGSFLHTVTTTSVFSCGWRLRKHLSIHDQIQGQALKNTSYFLHLASISPVLLQCFKKKGTDTYWSEIKSESATGTCRPSKDGKRKSLKLNTNHPRDHSAKYTLLVVLSGMMSDVSVTNSPNRLAPTNVFEISIKLLQLKEKTGRHISVSKLQISKIRFTFTASD